MAMVVAVLLLVYVWGYNIDVILVTHGIWFVDCRWVYVFPASSLLIAVVPVAVRFLVLFAATTK